MAFAEAPRLVNLGRASEQLVRTAPVELGTALGEQYLGLLEGGPLAQTPPHLEQRQTRLVPGAEPLSGIEAALPQFASRGRLATQPLASACSTVRARQPSTIQLATGDRASAGALRLIKSRLPIAIGHQLCPEHTGFGLRQHNCCARRPSDPVPNNTTQRSVDHLLCLLESALTQIASRESAA
jgi:hypothetical protein